MYHNPVAITKKEAEPLVKITFPEYRGRKFRLQAHDTPVDVTSYWDGGSRSYYAAVDLNGMKSVQLPQNGTPFDGGPIAPDGVMIPVGKAIVEHRIIQGKDYGIIVHVNVEQLPKLLKET